MAAKAGLSQKTMPVAPIVAAQVATRDFVETNSAGLEYGGWGAGDLELFGDKASMFQRALLLNSAGGFKSLGINAGASAVPMQHAYVIPVKRSMSITGVRYVTGTGSGTTGNTVTVTAYTGTSLAAMTKGLTVAAPFTTAATFTQVPFGSSMTVPPGYLVLVFTVTAINSTASPPRMATNSAVAYGGVGLLAPAAGQSLAIYRLASSALPTTLDFTTGWTGDQLPPWMAAY